MSIWVILNFLNQLSNAGTLRMLNNRMWYSWNSEVQNGLVHHYFSPVLSRNVIYNAECFAFMNRTCLRTIKHTSLYLFQCRISSFTHVPFQRWEPHCLQMYVLGSHFDLLRTGRFSSILHGSRVILDDGSTRYLIDWIKNWLVRLETSGELPNS